MSNKFSATRQLLKRPKVCLSKLKPFPGPQVRVCGMLPLTATINSFETVSFDYEFFEPLAPDDSIILLSYGSTFGLFTGPPTMINGGTIAALFDPEGMTGESSVEVSGVSEADTICFRLSVVTVLPS